MRKEVVLVKYRFFKNLFGPVVLFLSASMLGACGGGGGGSVAGPSSPPPSGGGGSGGTPQVSLSARETLVDQGQSTVLQWSSSGASQCQASGGWSGSRPTSGNATVGPISQQTTYSLSCAGTGASAMAMISVQVNGTVTLNWQAPDEREDGTPLENGLAGYRVYYGSFSRSYTDSVRVNDPRATQQSLRLPSGLYYIAMTAVDRAGLESDYSNEVTRRVN